MDKSTIICRCEELNIEEIEEAINQGAVTFNDIKRLTRCGMGPCQSKVCMDLVANIIHENTGKPLSEIPLPRLRTPLKPIRIKTLVNHNSTNSAVTSVLDEVELGDSEVK